MCDIHLVCAHKQAAQHKAEKARVGGYCTNRDRIAMIDLIGGKLTFGSPA
jgi:hypothetical protein